MGGGQLVGDGTGESDGVLGFGSVGAVVARRVDLVVETVGPVVSSNIVEVGIDISAEVVFTPHVPGREP